MNRPDTVDDGRWAAVVHRTLDADGQFYYAVRSTGIYCRPTCPSKRPRRDNVIFFETAGQAEQAGFRACLRCHPREVNQHLQVVSQVRHLLDTEDSPPTLTELGRAVGFSPHHLQRLFKRVTGLSPKEYAAARRVERLKAGLRAGDNVTTALYNAGFGSASALYSGANKHLGMSPGAYRAGGQGVTVRYTLAETPLGEMLLATTGSGICALWFGEAEGLVTHLQREFPQALLVRNDPELVQYANAIFAYLHGDQRGLDLPLDVQGTAFQLRVWSALRAIPYGETRSYQEIARLIGASQSVRAVARACATNPVALLVPCHRVVRTNGEVSGYRWGVERKRALLDKERAR